MSTETKNNPMASAGFLPPGELLCRDFEHIRSHWWCFLLLGILLVLSGSAAIIFPALTILTTVVAVKVLGIMLMVSGVAMIVTDIWAGRWSGMLLQLLVGILYVVVGWVFLDQPETAAVTLTMLIAAFLIVVGAFRIAAAFSIHFSHWGWALLNGVVTLLAGLIIYRQKENAIWVIGLLIGLELLFNGWSWIMLSLAVRNIPKPAA